MAEQTPEMPGGSTGPAESQNQAPASHAQTLSASRHVSSHLRLWVLAAAGLAMDLWTKHLAFSRLSLDPEDPGGVVIPNVMALRRSLNPGALFGLGKGLVPLFILASILALGFVLYLFIHSTRDRRSLHVALGLVLAGALGNLYDRAFVMADVIKVREANPRTGAERTYYLAGTILAENERFISIVEGLLHRPPDQELAATLGKVRPRLIERSDVVAVRRQGVVRDFLKMEPHIGSIQIWPWVFNLADSWLVIGVGLLMLNFWWDRRAEKAAAAPATPAG